MKVDGLILANYLDKYAETGKEYVKILKKIIKQNNLTEFDDVKLLPSSKKLKNKFLCIEDFWIAGGGAKPPFLM